MQVAAATVLAILFLLIPHQEPRADSGSEAAGVSETTDRSAVPAVAESDGYVWSREAGRDERPALAPASEHLQTDGYSWSARSDRTALDAMR